MIGAIILGLVLIVLMGVAEQTFSKKPFIETNEDGKRRVLFENLEEDGWARAIGFGLIVAIINYFTPKLSGVWLVFGPIFFVVMILAYVYLVQRWLAHGKRFLALVLFAIIAFLLFWTTKATVEMTIACLKLKDGFASLISVVPTLLLIAAIGSFILERLFGLSYKWKGQSVARDGETVNKELVARSRVMRIIAIIVAVIVTIMLLVTLAQGVGAANFNWPPSIFSKSSSTETTEAAKDNSSNTVIVDSGKTNTTKPEEKSPVTETQKQEDIAEATKNLTVRKLSAEELNAITLEKYNDISQELLESSLSTCDKARTETTGFSDALTFGFSKNAKNDEMFRELEEEILRNPVYGVTVANAIKDKKLGSQTIASLNPWLEEFVKLNESRGVSHWVEVRDNSGTRYVTEEYRTYAATLCTWLERLVSQGVQTRTTAENWRLNSASSNNDRKGELSDYQYTKEALVMSYVGKNGVAVFTMGFNAHDKRPEYFVQPGTPSSPSNNPKPPKGDDDKDPDPPPDDDGGEDPTPPGPTPPGPTPPGPTPKYNKDPEKAPTENTEMNDDPGPGPNTNNGKGAQTSTKDETTNSNHDSYTDYEEGLKQSEQINNSQKEGGDSNKPSTPKPSTNTNVDNNGKTGTGNGSIDNASTTPSYDKPADGSSLSSSSDGAWGGPPD